MVRSGHTVDPSGPTHQYMLGGLRDMPAINPQGSQSPKAGPAVVTATTAAQVSKGMDTQSQLSRNLSPSGGEKHHKIRQML